MRRALLILTPKERAIFSKRAATEGVHPSRPHPTGSSLLGWAAATLYEDFDKKGKAFDVFHSGTVRFSDALLVAHDGFAAFPMPNILMERKSGEKAVGDDRILKSDFIWVGRTAFSAVHDKGVQAEALKGGFVAASLLVPKVVTGGRLRTATEEGRAKNGALFGYSHVEPVTDGDYEVRYAAMIEDDENKLDQSGWDDLRNAFTQKSLRLGRAAATGYGGWYGCTWIDNPMVELWPAGSVGAGEKQLRVWLLSDLAVIDDNGAPSFAPQPELLGLPPGGRLVGGESAVTTRRFAPWNRYLGTHDFERQVIEAGSVLTYCYPGGVPVGTRAPRLAGLFREQGFGRIWVNPPMLAQSQPQEDPSVKAIAEKGVGAQIHGDTAPEGALAKWADKMARLADTSERDRLAREWTEAWKEIDPQVGRDGPSPSQWADVSRIVVEASDADAMLKRLFAIDGGVCDSEEWTRTVRVRSGTDFARRKIRDWLKECIENGGRLIELNKLPVAHLHWAVNQLVKSAARLRREGANSDA